MIFLTQGLKVRPFESSCSGGLPSMGSHRVGLD